MLANCCHCGFRDCCRLRFNAIKRAEGSIQDIDEIPQDVRDIFRTAWELPMRSPELNR